MHPKHYATHILVSLHVFRVLYFSIYFWDNTIIYYISYDFYYNVLFCYYLLSYILSMTLPWNYFKNLEASSISLADTNFCFQLLTSHYVQYDTIFCTFVQFNRQWRKVYLSFLVYVLGLLCRMTKLSLRVSKKTWSNRPD